MPYIKYLTSISKNDYVSVSGGIDSIAAAFWLNRYKGVNNVYHFNHKLRPQNDEMEDSVRQFCKDTSMNLYVQHATSTLNTENEFREQRLGSFIKNISENLVTAHTLNDAVESYLFNCFRGHPKYLPIQVETNIENSDKKILHPFLITQKNTFVSIVNSFGLHKYIVDDDTNSMVDYCQRNWIRHEIIPKLRERNFSFEKIVKKQYLTHAKTNIINVRNRRIT